MDTGCFHLRAIVIGAAVSMAVQSLPAGAQEWLAGSVAVLCQVFEEPPLLFSKDCTVSHHPTSSAQSVHLLWLPAFAFFGHTMGHVDRSPPSGD